VRENLIIAYEEQSILERIWCSWWLKMPMLRSIFRYENEHTRSTAETKLHMNNNVTNVKNHS